MTNNETKQEILRQLSEFVEYCPDIRFGQLIANLSVIAREPTPEAWPTVDTNWVNFGYSLNGVRGYIPPNRVLLPAFASTKQTGDAVVALE